MTALIAIEEYPLDKILTAEGVSAITGSKMKLEEGETITVENLLYGLMLPSGNDAAHVLSENYPGGKEAFVKRMNVRARNLRLENTHFVDPAGFENENYTTAFNLSRLASYAMENKVFRKIVSTREKSVHDTSGQLVHELKNLNALLGINGVNGIKTGFTEEAGGVLVTSVEQEGKEYIIVVLNSSDRFEDTQAIIINAIKNITLMSY
jgi:D-alanyl-D-alanine carboxypeptidase